MRFRFGDHSLDTERRELRRGSELVALEPQVFDLLVYLVQNRDRVVSKDDVLEAVWGGRIVSESALTSRLTAARKAIGDNGGSQRLIRTVPRKGIRFIGVVHEEAAAAPASSSAPRLSIVVLPFVNLSSDPELEYFADGITDDLTTDLSRISGSFVIACSTAFTYKGKPIEVKQIGRELGVRYVLEGSVRRAGDRVQVNVQLIDADSGGHLWADRLDTDRRNLTEAQREITGRLARTVNLELVEDIARRIEQEQSIDAAAPDLVMLGEAAWRRWLRSTGRDRTQSLQDAQRCFERALGRDPRSIDARIGIARILVNNVLFGWSTSDQQDSARAEQLLLEAIEADPNRSEVYRYLGLLRRLQNRLNEARATLETALAIGPNNVPALVQLAWTLLFLGEPEAGLAAGEEALRRSPHDPEMRGVYQQLAWCQLLLGRVEPAIDMLTKAAAGRPRQWVNHFALGAALGLKGDLAGAKAALAQSLAIKPEVDSLPRFRACRPWGNSKHWSLFEKTAAAGLRRAGFPNESPEPDRVLATVLFTDIADSTRRAAEIGDHDWRVLLDRHDDAVRQELARFRGREVKTLGVGFLATFDSPARALRCATAIINRVRALGIAVRAGLHTGEIQIEHDEVGGIAVNIAARIAELAGGGEILVSGTVRDLVVGAGLSFDDRGDHAVKGLPEPLRLFAART